MTKSDYDKERIAERIAKLAWGIAVIKVGAASEVEMKEKKLRIEDALNATKAAVDEGIVAGGGVALLKAAKVLENLKVNPIETLENMLKDSPKNFHTPEEIIGANIVARALTYPVRQIADNAGKEGAVVVNEVANHKDANYWYDAARDIYTDLVKAGIIDPTKVARSALENAVSIAWMFLTTEALIVDAPSREKDHDHGHGGGGMGGMWGMGGMGF